MRVLVIDNSRATPENPKTGGYVQKIGQCIEAAGFEVEYLLPRTARKGVWGKLLRYLDFYLNLLRFDFSGFDLLYVNHYPYVAVPLLIRQNSAKAMAFHWHGEDLLPRSRAKALLFVPMIRMIPSRAWHFVPSEYFKRQLKTRLPSARVIVSPSGGIDIGHFSSRKASGDQAHVRLGFASGLSAGKGLTELNLLISRMDELEQETGRTIEVHFIDYGPGSLAPPATGSSWQHKLVRWDILPPEKMPEFYRAIDILLFPTRRKAESLGLIPLEAMASGLPVLATNRCACPEFVVPGVSGELFDPDDPIDMMRKLVSCIGRLDTYRPREIVEQRYASGFVIRQYRDTLPKIVERQGCRRN